MDATQPPSLSQRARDFARLLIEPNGSLEDLHVLARGAHALILELADRVDTSVQISDEDDRAMREGFASVLAHCDRVDARLSEMRTIMSASTPHELPRRPRAR